MSTTIKTGWLNDKNGDKFAPKTLTSQVQTSDGVLLEDKIQADIQAARVQVDDKLSDTSENPIQNKAVYNVLDTLATEFNEALEAKADDVVATSSEPGLMSAADKKKLDGIATNANNYTLPSAGSSLGGVKSGGDVTISDGVITVKDDSHNHVISNIDGLQDALNAKATKDAASQAAAGLMSASDKTKLDGIPADPARAFYITVTQTGADSYSVDKTGQEILDAYDAGCVLIADYGYEGYHYCMSKYTETQGDGVDVVINSSTIRFFANNAEYNSVITIYIQLGKYGPNDINNIRVEHYKSTMLVDHLGNSSNPHNVTLTQLGVNATADELNYVDGVTSNIQTQLDNVVAQKAQVQIITWGADD